jgi:predicted Na+-dependent transporter
MTTSRVRAMLAAYPELAAVLAATVIGLSAQRPLSWLAARQGINVLLAVLVFATAVTVEPAALRRAALAWRSLLAALAAGVIVLPALSWAASRMVPAGSLRDGVLAAGLAPCEIASVATTAMAGGEAALAAGLLIGSTLAAIAVAGPALALETGHAGFSPGGIAGSLALVVALPLAAGIALRATLPAAARALPPGRGPAGHHTTAAAGAQSATAGHPTSAGAQSATAGHPTSAGAQSATAGRISVARAERAASRTAVAAVAALVALIAAEVHLSASYASVAGALAVFLLASALVGWLLGIRARRQAAAALLLTTSMRDFAIAAGLAAAAFGPPAAAPLGLYGILVLTWGTAAAGVLRRRTPAAECQYSPLPTTRPQGRGD